MSDALIVPNAEPFYLPGGRTGCLLLHGFTAMPEEMRLLGDFLAGEGHTVLGIRLAGHATDPKDLARVHWSDWLVSVEEGLALLKNVTERVVILGMSMGGMIALVAAERYPVAGVVGLSTPSWRFSLSQLIGLRLTSWIQPMARKPWVKPGGPLPKRREPDYPAYPRYPAKILFEVANLQTELLVALPRIKVPALLIHASGDASVPEEAIHELYARLGSADKQEIVLNGLDHSIVRHADRQLAFDILAPFVKRVAGE